MDCETVPFLQQETLVGTRWIGSDPGTGIPVSNPASEAIIGHVPNLGAAETRYAIEVARETQKIWAAQTAKYRSDILRNWYDLIIRHRQELGYLLTLEQGKPLVEAIGEIEYGASYVEWFSQEARRAYGDVVPEHSSDKRLLVLKQPIGVVAAITPWNFPSAMITRKVAPALAAGCAIVLKPAAQTPFSAIALARLALDAGLPLGLFSVVTGSARAIGAEMTSNPIVRKLTFTGSTEVGAILYGQCAPTIKKLGLELGGNAPFIVFEDADLDAAVEGVLIAKFRNNGQTCVCANRIYVQSSVYQTFADKLASAIKSLKIGNGLDDETVLGPLIDNAAVEKVEEHVRDAVSKGAVVAAGGKRHALGGNFFEATVLTGVNEEMAVAREETFGPIAPLFQFDDEADVIARANDTEFGLASYFYAGNLARVFRVAEALEFGMVGVNTGVISTPEVPFGGIKTSGLGREGSRYGLEDFLELKYVCLGGIS